MIDGEVLGKRFCLSIKLQKNCRIQLTISNKKIPLIEAQELKREIGDYLNFRMN